MLHIDQNKKKSNYFKLYLFALITAVRHKIRSGMGFCWLIQIVEFTAYLEKILMNMITWRDNQSKIFCFESNPTLF